MVESYTQMVPADALRWSLVSTRLGLRISVLMLVALSWIPLAAAPEQFEGKPIASVQFQPRKQPLTFDQLMALTPLHVGQPLQMSDVRDSIQRLYQTGEYAEIAVDATLAPAGVNLKFASGAIATLFASYKAYSDKWESETLSLFGSEGTIRCGGGDSFEVISRKAPSWASSFVTHRPPGSPVWIGQLEAFHASIVEGAPNRADGQDALKTMALIDAIYESGARGGVPIHPQS